jgi:hypothetical protein
MREFSLFLREQYNSGHCNEINILLCIRRMRDWLIIGTAALVTESTSTVDEVHNIIAYEGNLLNDCLVKAGEAANSGRNPKLCPN